MLCYYHWYYMSFQKNKKRRIDVDEIFMDAENIPGYHRESLEGMLEYPIEKRVFKILGATFLFVAIFFLGRVVFLDTVKSKALLERAQKNYLRLVPLVPERGILYDRNWNPLVKNEYGTEGTTTTRWLRKYPEEGFLHIVGFINKGDATNLPKGISGLEAHYDEILRGIPGKKIEEVNAKGEVVAAGINENSEPGGSILTSIAEELQIKLNKSIAETKNNYGFKGGAGIFMDAENGEILALASIPEFDPNILVANTSKKTIQNLISNPEKPFLNRAVSGLYPPGSTVKLAVSAGALNENIIDPQKQILSTGSISIPNPYHPDKPSIFPDWKALGWVDMRRAIAFSSDVYFYTVGGGFGDQKGLGVWNLEKYFSLFGFAEKTGIDLPGEKQGSLPDPNRDQERGRKWSIGDTYHLAIGQGDMQVTPIEIAVYAAAIASRGTLFYPHIAKAIVDKNKKIIENFSYTPKRTGLVKNDIFTIIQEGMRRGVLEGTASGLSSLPIEVAAKTGTAEIGDTGRVDSWSLGFLPYKKPKIAFAVVMENGDKHNTIGATFVVSQVLQWMAQTNFLDKLK